MRALAYSIVLLGLMTVPSIAQSYQAVPVTLPNGRTTMGVLETATGRVWVATCRTVGTVGGMTRVDCGTTWGQAPVSPTPGSAASDTVLEPLTYLTRDGKRSLTPPPLGK